ncbi:MAG: hypothetical protein HY005_02605 [Candidatus Staskawiczbacteria bacterium]|nr:hypothetical protein [Candidatus Staskawiczbacteria bacterium]MBI3337489.1 hypothetical protein [Candidatus Staskawiczbacteria bacterium]
MKIENIDQKNVFGQNNITENNEGEVQKNRKSFFSMNNPVIYIIAVIITGVVILLLTTYLNGFQSK